MAPIIASRLWKFQSFRRRSRKALVITETELNVMAALAMNGAEQQAEKRIQHAGGDRHSHRIVDKREKKILANVAHGRAAERSRADDAAQVAVQQRDSGAFDGDVGSGAHGDADVGLRKRGRVVHAVARHGDDVPFRLQALHDFAF